MTQPNAAAEMIAATSHPRQDQFLPQAEGAGSAGAGPSTQPFAGKRGSKTWASHFSRGRRTGSASPQAQQPHWAAGSDAQQTTVGGIPNVGAPHASQGRGTGFAGPQAQRPPRGAGCYAQRTTVGAPSLTGDFFQAVAKSAHGGNPYRAFFNFLAQPVDVNLDRVVADFLAPFTQALDQLVLADQATGAL